MGLLHKLFRQKLLSSIKLNFYNEDEVSVDYESKILDGTNGDRGKIEFFAFYYAKILYNLDRSDEADALIAKIGEVVIRILRGGDNLNILLPGQKLVEARSISIAKKYSANFYQASDGSKVLETKANFGGEGYYAPCSVLMFLQYLINNLSHESRRFLGVVLGGMDEYYQGVGDYYELKSIIDAPVYGLRIASEILDRE